MVWGQDPSLFYSTYMGVLSAQSLLLKRLFFSSLIYLGSFIKSQEIINIGIYCLTFKFVPLTIYRSLDQHYWFLSIYTKFQNRLVHFPQHYSSFSIFVLFPYTVGSACPFLHTNSLEFERDCVEFIGDFFIWTILNHQIHGHEISLN